MRRTRMYSYFIVLALPVCKLIYDSAQEDPYNLCIGRPKAIPLSHRYLLGYASCHLFPASEDESERGVNLSTLPLFHVSHPR